MISGKTELTGGFGNNSDGLKLLKWSKLNKPDASAFIMSAYKKFSYAAEVLKIGRQPFLNENSI